MEQKQAQDLNKNEVASGNNAKNQYLTFILDQEEYGVEILQVMELRGWEKPISIPNYPDFVKGVINIRGIIIPIIDLRHRFNLEQVEYGPLTVVIVLSINEGDKERQIGIVVDAVSEVYDINEHQLKDVPDMENREDNRFIKGLACFDDKVVILLDSNLLVSIDDLPDASDENLEQFNEDEQPSESQTI